MREGIAGWVLAGGESTRMGRDKALLPWGGRPVLLHLVELLERLASPVGVVGPPERYRDLVPRVIGDLRPGLGPLAGIEAALQASMRDWNLVVACDNPTLDERRLRALAARAVQSPAACVAAGSPSEPQPLCAAYHRRCLPTVREALDRGRGSVRGVLESLEVEWFGEAGAVWPAGANTPGEWEDLCEEAQRAS
ncbi:MAG TPA: molybdenum cofactor guanylyltransferase [Solibacterales bacterium]|nr:molybdenum cofactor guanylyltransferase [Bryobacterales bacterium]